MVQTYKNAQGKACVQGTSGDLEFVSCLMRIRLCMLLGPEKGEDFFRKMPAFRTLALVALELGKSPNN